jgi:hypothetical protein
MKDIRETKTERKFRLENSMDLQTRIVPNKKKKEIYTRKKKHKGKINNERI